ncbi:hypothetical protein [Microcoleus sp. S13C4]|uniref:hypothetical protein n=1 Tax=Microcoleus sp. S13C4 TaxID=3055410 RepID=UPI002FD74FF6
MTALRSTHGGLGIELLDYLMPEGDQPMRNNWKSCDIANLQVELMMNVVEQTVELLRLNRVQFVSSQLVQFTSMPYRQGCVVKDPNGHAMLLMTE